MQKRDLTALSKYCRGMADLLELRDWTVMVTVDEPEKGPRDDYSWVATSESIPGQKIVRLTFDPSTRDLPPEAFRQLVAHELIHAHFAPLVDTIRTDLARHLKNAVHVTFNDGATRWLEFGVDAMADAVAKHLPVIHWPSDRKPNG